MHQRDGRKQHKAGKRVRCSRISPGTAPRYGKPISIVFGEDDEYNKRPVVIQMAWDGMLSEERDIAKKKRVICEETDWIT